MNTWCENLARHVLQRYPATATNDTTVTVVSTTDNANSNGDTTAVAAADDSDVTTRDTAADEKRQPTEPGPTNGTGGKH